MNQSKKSRTRSDAQGHSLRFRINVKPSQEDQDPDVPEEFMIDPEGGPESKLLRFACPERSTSDLLVLVLPRWLPTCRHLSRLKVRAVSNRKRRACKTLVCGGIIERRIAMAQRIDVFCFTNVLCLDICNDFVWPHRYKNTSRILGFMARAMPFITQKE